MAQEISINEQKIVEYMAQKIADYWNGKQVPVSGVVGAQWSSFYFDETTQKRERVPGTFDKITGAVGTIQASASGSSVTFTIVYNLTITNIG